MTKLEEILNAQIETASVLLQRTKEIPDGRSSLNLPGFIRYDERFTMPLTNDTDAWEKDTLELLRTIFGDDSRQATEFQDGISKKNTYFKFREELCSDLEHHIAYLKALIKANQLKQELNTQKKIKQEDGKTPLVFISHSSKDKDFVEALVSLLESLGFDNTNLFCSSIPDYWVGLSQDIFDSLYNLFVEHELFVIFIQSPRYYESPISLNEMGAAWVLKTNHCSILTKDMRGEDMKGVVNSNTIFIKVDTPEASSRMNELKNQLTELFGLKLITETQWERKRNTFLNAVTK